MMSHFYGVDTITWVYYICVLVKCISPVSYLTVMFNVLSLLERLPVIYDTKAFIGAIYTTLNAFKSIV